MNLTWFFSFLSFIFFVSIFTVHAVSILGAVWFVHTRGRRRRRRCKMMEKPQKRWKPAASGAFLLGLRESRTTDIPMWNESKNACVTHSPSLRCVNLREYDEYQSGERADRSGTIIRVWCCVCIVTPIQLIIDSVFTKSRLPQPPHQIKRSTTQTTGLNFKWCGIFPSASFVLINWITLNRWLCAGRYCK